MIKSRSLKKNFQKTMGLFFGKSPSPKANIDKAPAPKPAPEKPKTMFEKSQHWQRSEFLRKSTEKSLSIGGRGFVSHEKKKMINELFPHQRFGTHVSRQDATRRLKELRKQETFAKTYKDKQRVGALKRYLEDSTGLKGKY